MPLFLVLITFLASFAPLGAAAQGQFSPVITVNDDAITQYELTQRIQLLEALGQRGTAEQFGMSTGSGGSLATTKRPHTRSAGSESAVCMASFTHASSSSLADRWAYELSRACCWRSVSRFWTCVAGV